LDCWLWLPPNASPPRLRGLTQRTQREYQDANDLKQVLVEASGRESELKSETEARQTKSRLFRVQSKESKPSPPPPRRAASAETWDREQQETGELSIG